MNVAKVGAIAVAVILGHPQLAHAISDAESYGTDVEAQACEKEYVANPSWSKAQEINAPMKAGQVSEPCKAEIEKRSKLCLSDPQNKKYFADASYGLAHTDSVAWCNDKAFTLIGWQIGPLIEKRKEAAERAEAAKAKLDSVEMPVAEMHNAALEKAVATAYQKDYPGKILKVLVDRWDEDLEKDAFKRVTGRNLVATVVNKQADGKCQIHNELWLQHGNGKSFSGPLSARGAGSATDIEILCSKVESAASTGTKSKKNK